MHVVPTSALVTFALWANGTDTNEQRLLHSVQAGARYLEESVFTKDPTYTLFRREDTTAWITFTAVFVVLITFDNLVLHRRQKALSVGAATFYTLFWVVCAFGFCGYIYWRSGADPALSWMSGYLLEWMLSFDNLFVFHLIFSVYACPDHLKHRPLYLGICGAVFFRLLFIFVGEYLMHAMLFAHFVFGAFLLWTGFKAAAFDEEDDDPSQQFMVQLLQRKVPFVSAYDARGAFFVRVPVDANGHTLLPAGCGGETGSDPECAPLLDGEKEGVKGKRCNIVDFATACVPGAAQYRWRATMLFLVVICLEVSDLLFAVDSVSAIVAQVHDLFLAYTSAVFAMLGLRATFFIIDVLVKLFSLLKYGVAAVLIFIGAKLMVGKIYHVPPGLVCLVLFTAVAGSMVASVIQDRYFPTKEEEQDAAAPAAEPVAA